MLDILAAVLPAVISGGSRIIGGMMNSGAQNRANAQNAQLNYDQMDINQEQYRRSQGFTEASYADQMAFARQQFDQAQINRNQDVAMQYEFAKNGVQWRADDARQAGLHPLAALGMQPVQSTPIQVGGFSAQGTGGTSPMGISTHGMEANTHMGDALSGLGQDISKAVEKTLAKEDKDASYVTALQQLDIKKKTIENAILQNSLTGPPRMGRSSGTPTSSRKLLDGQGDAPSKDEEIKTEAELIRRRLAAEMERVKAEPGKHTPSLDGVEPGSAGAYKLYDTGGGTKMLGKSQPYAESTEDDFIGNAVDTAMRWLGLVGPRGDEKYQRTGPFYEERYWEYNKRYPDRGFHTEQQAKRWKQRGGWN